MKRMLLVFMALLSLSFSAFAAVNLNTATQAELETLEGVGPVKAQAILDYRKKNGGFKSIDDLNKVPGFGDKTVASLKGKVAVSGSVAAAAPTDSMAKARAAKAEKAAAEKAAASKAITDKKK